MILKLYSAVAIAATTSLLTAQSPTLDLTPSGISLSTGPSKVAYRAVSRPNVAYALLVDLDTGLHHVLGENIRLGLSPFLAVVAAGTMPNNGWLTGSLAVPLTPANIGQALYFQHISVDAQSPNGVFQMSNGSSLIAYNAPAAVVETFDGPLSDFTGNFAKVRNRLEAAPVRTRVHSTVDPTGVPFLGAVANPLNSYGSRLQMVFRPQDLGSTGEAEVLTSIRWRPFFGLVKTESFEHIELSVAHSHVSPDFTVGAFSALPNFPNSGLDALFANNYTAGTAPTKLWGGRYDIRPSMINQSGYVPYPKPTADFEYNGTDSLLIEFATSPNRVPQSSLNGQFGQLMVTSSRWPAARSHTSGNQQQNGQVVIPGQVTSGLGDNFMYDYQLEFVRYKSTATRKTTPFPQGTPVLYDWQPPILASHVPPGTKIELEFQGVNLKTGQKTKWSNSVDVADGLRGILYRITFTANRTTGEVPSIDTLVIPVR